MHALTVIVEEAGGNSRVIATANKTTIVLIAFRCFCANALVGREAWSGGFLGTNFGFGHFLQEITEETCNI